MGIFVGQRLRRGAQLDLQPCGFRQQDCLLPCHLGIRQEQHLRGAPLKSRQVDKIVAWSGTQDAEIASLLTTRLARPCNQRSRVFLRKSKKKKKKKKKTLGFIPPQKKKKKKKKKS